MVTVIYDNCDLFNFNIITMIYSMVTIIWYLELLDKLQKRICRTVGPSLAASLEPLAHGRNVASLSLFYRYYFL